MSMTDRTIARFPPDEKARLLAVIRGHLRKLDGRAARAVQQKAERERQQLEATVADYARNSAAWAAEIATLAEAEARHKQRLDDEWAAGRAADLRSAIRHGHSEAAMAARKLGREAPKELLK